MQQTPLRLCPCFQWLSKHHFCGSAISMSQGCRGRQQLCQPPCFLKHILLLLRLHICTSALFQAVCCCHCAVRGPFAVHQCHLFNMFPCMLLRHQCCLPCRRLLCCILLCCILLCHYLLYCALPCSSAVLCCTLTCSCTLLVRHLHSCTLL